MERYLEQLIGDLKAATKYAPVNKPQNEMDDSSIMEELHEIDRIIIEEPEIPMHKIFGIDPIIFPPSDRLSDEQATILTNEILELWQQFNIDVVVPPNFPLPRLYPLLVKKFTEPFLYFPMGMTSIEFCDYDVSKCPFGDEYCMCKDIDTE